MTTAQCDPNKVTKTIFSAEGVRLVVPDALQDKAIRWLIERGRSIETAYIEAGASSITPDPAVRPCVREVLGVKYYDLEAGVWKRTGRHFTCNGFWDCYVEYISGNRRFPLRRASDRRMQIATGLFAPSYVEDNCIRSHFHEYKDLEAAYRACNAEAVLPEWPGCIAFVSRALTADPTSDIYTALKTWYRLQYLSGWPPSPDGNGIPPPDGNGIPAHHHIPPPDKGGLLIVGAIAALLLFAR